MITISGMVKNQRGDALPDVNILFVHRDTGGVNILRTDNIGNFRGELVQGNYTYIAFDRGYKESSNTISVGTNGGEAAIPTIQLVQAATGDSYSPPQSIPGSLPSPYGSSMEKLFARLQQDEFSLEPKVSPEEARQAIGLFAVANQVYAGKFDRRPVGKEFLTDVLGVFALYYGFGKEPLSSRMPMEDSSTVWNIISPMLERLTTKLKERQPDISALEEDAKRQFNIGEANNVVANVQFPPLFRSYVELGSDPRLGIDILHAKQSDYFDKAKLEEIYDLLRSLKEVIAQVVRMLSKTGTNGVKQLQMNETWADVEEQALEVLQTIAPMRHTDDDDEKNAWSVLAILNEKSRDEILPYMALGINGKNLLAYALDIYLSEDFKINDPSPDSLENLFQPQGKEWWTSKIRSEAMVTKRYLPANWR